MRDKVREKEIPQPIPYWRKAETTPLTPMEALMEAEPFEEPVLSIIEMLGIRDKVVDLFDTMLNEEEKWILNATVTERMSLRELANQLGTSKTTVARVRDGALKKLRESLQDDKAAMDSLKALGLVE